MIHKFLLGVVQNDQNRLHNAKKEYLTKRGESEGNFSLTLGKL